jgi:hypothetical protein
MTAIAALVTFSYLSKSDGVAQVFSPWIAAGNSSAPII